MCSADLLAQIPSNHGIGLHLLMNEFYIQVCCMDWCARVCVCVCVRACVRACMHACMRMRACVHVCTNASVHV